MTGVSSTNRYLLLLTAAAVSALGIGLVGQAPAAPPVFTLQQAAAGRAAYQDNCAACHMPDLGGRNEAPPLAGANFMGTWRNRPTAALIDYAQTMPPGGADLSVETYLSIVSFILQSNGASAGQQALTPTTAALIGSVATGQAPAAAAAGGAGGGRGAAGAQAAGGGRGGAAQAPGGPGAPAGRGGAPGAPGGGGGRGGPVGLTATGEVKNFVPVTDDMLRNPGSRRLADGAAQLSGMELQPADPGDDEQRAEPQARLGVGDERKRRRQRADADRAQRHHVSDQSRQHDAGARRQDGRADLGEPRRSERGHRDRRDAQRRDLPGQDLHGDDRRAARRARRAHRQGGVGRSRGRQNEGLCRDRWPDGHQGEGDSRSRRVRSIRPGSLLHQRV